MTKEEFDSKEKFIQHVPNFSDFEPVKFLFDTQEELLNHELIKPLGEEHDRHGKMVFIKSKSHHRNPKIKCTLMVRNEAYDWWWVVGYTTLELDLEEYEHDKTK